MGNESMEFDVIFKTSRKIAFELKNAGIFYTSKPYDIYINGQYFMTSNRIVDTIEGLKPDTDYVITLQGDTWTAEKEEKTDYEFVTLDVREFGAKGDGIHNDTLAIQAAVLSCPEKSRVWIPKGTYKVSSIFLKSHVTIDMEEGSVLSMTTERDELSILPGLIESYDETSEYNLGTWEGNPLRMFSALITGIHVEDVVITGKGRLEGNAGYDNWWHEFRTIIGAYRPRMIFLNHCKNITIHGITTDNTPAWNIHPYFCSYIRFIQLNIFNPKISPNTDGMDPESCDHVEIVGTYFSVGDDCIAVKSGKIYMGKKYKKPSEYIEIRQCHMKDGHGSVTLGSELAAGIRHLTVKDCLFTDTDRGLRIKTRRGRGNDAVVEDVIFQRIVMNGVLSPFVVNSYYWDCDPDGHTEYVSSKSPLPVDERTPFIKEMKFKDIEAKNCHVCGAFIYGLPEAKIEKLTLENINITYTDYPTPEFPAMMAGVDKVTKKGIFINNVKQLVVNKVSITGQEGPAWEVENVDEIIEDGSIT